MKINPKHINPKILEEFYNALNEFITGKYLQSHTHATDEFLLTHYEDMILETAAYYKLGRKAIKIYEQLAKSLWEERNGTI